MHCFYFVASVAFVSFIACPAHAVDPIPSKHFDPIADFIETRLAGRVLETKTTEKLAGGRVETEFERRVMYFPPRRGPDSIEFDELVMIKQALYDLDEAGKRINSPPKVANRVGVSRISLRPRRSTGELHGTAEILSSSARPAVADSTPCRATWKDGALVLQTQTAFYADGFAEGGGVYPIAAESTTTFHIVDGKLSATEQSAHYEVDPETLRRVKQMGTMERVCNEVDGL